MKRFGKPVEAGTAPIVTLVDDPPAEPLSAFVESRRISLAGNGFDAEPATRLATLTREMLE